MSQTVLDFLGTSSCRTDIGNDTASFVLNGTLMVDTGWCCVQNLRTAGMEPTDIPYLLLTHWHHDHYLSLPSLLFYHLCLKGSLDHLTILGPAEDAARVVSLALDFLQTNRFYPAARPPVIVPLEPGQAFETDAFSLATTAALHAVQALCTVYTDKESQVKVGFTGDTAYQPGLGPFFRGCDILLHESSLGPVAADPAANARYLHSGALDAAKVAKEAGVPHLVLLHGSTQTREACIRAARTVFEGKVTWPERGERYLIAKSCILLRRCRSMK
jgi:ribonuclease Z